MGKKRVTVIKQEFKEPASSFEYAFTITLQPKLYVHDATEQYDLTFTKVIDELLKLCSRNLVTNDLNFSCVAELTKSYNVHYHGIIKMRIEGKPCMKKFHDAFRASKIFGHVDIKQMTDQKGWIEYISKDLVDTQNMVGRPPILYDGFGYIKVGDLTNMISSVVEGY